MQAPRPWPDPPPKRQMPIRIITHKLTYRELDLLGSDARLVPVLRERGMDVVYAPTMGCVAAPGSRLTWVDGIADRTFTWRGEVPESAEEIAARHLLSNLRIPSEIREQTEIQVTEDKQRKIRLED